MPIAMLLALAMVLLVATTACGRPAASGDPDRDGVEPQIVASPVASSVAPSPSFRPGTDSVSGRVLRLTSGGVVIRSAEQEIDVDLTQVVDVWRETSVAASAIEIGDDLFVNGGWRAPAAFIARYVYANIGRLDGVVISFDGREIVLGSLRGEPPFPLERRVELSAHVEIVRLVGGSERPADRTELAPGREIGMVIYGPRGALPRATRIWAVDAPAAPPAPRVIERPRLAAGKLAPPVSVGASAPAGVIVMHLGGTWWYEGRTGAVIAYPTMPDGSEHRSPAGGPIAVERLSATTPGSAYAIAKELAIREQGAERVIYRAPGDGFYWSGWSPDGRYVALWEIGTFSGSLDMDGRPLVVIDVRTGARTDLGSTLLRGTTAWTAPHTLAYVAGTFRMVWDTKTLRLWSPEGGIRDVTSREVAAFAPAWSSDGRSLWFVSGPAGQWDPLQAVAGLGVGDRRISVWDAASGSTRSIPHEPGYVEEGVRPSRDGAQLLVLRRRTAAASDVRSIPDVDLEVWLTAAAGTHGSPLVRFPGAGLNAYGHYSGPTEWAWSE